MWSEVRRFCGGLCGTESNACGTESNAKPKPFTSALSFASQFAKLAAATGNQVNTSKTHPPLPMILVWTKWGFNATLENLRKHETQFVNLFGEPNPKPRKRMGSAHQSPW